MDPHRKDVPLIEMRGITKSFGAVQALRGADLKLMPNEVLGLVGDNAAGKSTLMKTLTGVHHPDSGKLFFEGKPVIFDTPRASRAHGIEMIYQNLALAPNLDVVANVFLGREKKRAWAVGFNLRSKSWLQTTQWQRLCLLAKLDDVANELCVRVHIRRCYPRMRMRCGSTMKSLPR